MNKENKQFVKDRALACCEYCLCQAAFSPDPFVIEHIIPISKQGSHELSNLAFSCQGCNNHKYTATTGIDPVTGSKIDLYHPRKDVWEDHFEWTQDFSIILGKTPKGRATIERLNLNRAGVVNLRKVLRQFGKHPFIGKD